MKERSSVEVQAQHYIFDFAWTTCRVTLRYAYELTWRCCDKSSVSQSDRHTDHPTQPVHTLYILQQQAWQAWRVFRWGTAPSPVAPIDGGILLKKKRLLLLQSAKK